VLKAGDTMTGSLVVENSINDLLAVAVVNTTTGTAGSAAVGVTNESALNEAFYLIKYAMNHATRPDQAWLKSDANAPIRFGTNDTERMQISGTGALGFAGANYGTSGQILTSGGSATSPTWSSTFAGNASTATTLGTGRTFSVTGDATGTSAAFNGAANASIPVTLATVNSNVGQFAITTVNGKGLVTAATNLSATGDATGTSSGASIALTLANTAVTPATYGSATQVGTFTVDSKGRLTSASNATIAIPASAVTSGTFADGRIAQSNVTQHQAALALAASQITSGTFADGRIAQSNVTQHQAALTILETQITNGALLARNAGDETITGSWTYTNPISASSTPTLDQHLANKAYVDSVAAGLTWKQSVRVATTANITLSGLQTIDGVSVIAGDRVLVKNQTTTALNGIWVASAALWSRSTDMNSPVEFSGATVFVLSGTVNDNTGWTQTNIVVSVDTTPVVWQQFSGSDTYVWGDGLSASGNTVNVGGTAGRIVVSTDNIDLATVGSPGTYRSVTTDSYGRVTAGTNPTTLAGYGITDAQPLDTDLTAVAGLSTSGLIVRTGSGTATTRSIAVSGTGLSVSNADGVSGNPTITSNATSANTASTIVARDASGNFTAGTITGGSFIPTSATAPSNGLYLPAANTIGITSNTTERLRINSTGAFGIAGANYGTAGQVLVSDGSAAAPAWSSSPILSAATLAATGVSAATIGTGTYGSWSAADTDIDGLISGSTSGVLFESQNSAHFTVGLRSNDAGDGFQIISKGNATTPATDPYTVLAFEVKSSGATTVGGTLDTVGAVTSGSSVTATTQFYAPTGDTVGAPGYSWSGDPDSGWWRPGANTLSLATNGVDRIRVSSSGTVGFSVIPTYKQIEVLVGPFASNVAPDGYAIRSGVAAGGGEGWLSGLFLESNGSGSPSVSIYSPNSTTAASNTAQKAIEVAGAAGAQNIKFYAGGAEKLNIAANGAWGLAGANYGTSGQVLISSGSSSAPVWSSTPTLTGTNFTGIPNAALTNNSLTIGSTNIALGGTSTSLAGLVNLTGSGNADFSRFLGDAADTVTAPSFSWTTDTDTGMYTPSANTISWATAGVERATLNATGLTLAGVLLTSEVRTSNGTEVVINAGESNSVATGQTGEQVYLNAEGGVQINSSPDNWVSGWAGRYTATLLNSAGNAIFPGDVSATTFVGSGASLTALNASQLTSGTLPDGRLTGTYTGLTSITSTTFVGALTGNASTATSAATLTTARTIAISGGVTGTATSFNGSANITIPITAMNASSLSTGTVPDARISGAYTGITTLTLTTGLIIPDGTAATPAIRFTADTNCGIYRHTTDTVGVNTALYVNGDVTAFSDSRVKAEVRVIDHALSKVEKVRGVTYIRSDLNDGKRYAGVIAQEVEEVLPEVVRTGDDGMKSVAYGNMVGLLIEAVKELSDKVKVLEAKLADKD
jgi:hypothetical protein